MCVNKKTSWLYSFSFRHMAVRFFSMYESISSCGGTHSTHAQRFWCSSGENGSLQNVYGNSDVHFQHLIAYANEGNWYHCFQNGQGKNWIIFSFYSYLPVWIEIDINKPVTKTVGKLFHAILFLFLWLIYWPTFSISSNFNEIICKFVYFVCCNRTFSTEWFIGYFVFKLRRNFFRILMWWCSSFKTVKCQKVDPNHSNNTKKSITYWK